MGKRSWKMYPQRMKERAVERMLLGENVTRLAQELGVDRTTLYGWKRKLERRQRVRLPGSRGISGTCGSRSWKPRWVASKGWWGGSGWSWIFSTVPCEESRRNGSGTPAVAGQHLRRNPQPGAVARRTDDRADVRAGTGEPRRVLSALVGERAERGGDGAARCDPASRHEASLLRLLSDRGAAAT